MTSKQSLSPCRTTHPSSLVTSQPLVFITPKYYFSSSRRVLVRQSISEDPQISPNLELLFLMMKLPATCVLVAVLFSAVSPTSALNKRQDRSFKFLNELYDSIPVAALRQLKQVVGSEQYSLLKISAGDNLSASEQAEIENVGHENEVDLEKRVELTLRDCQRHDHAAQGPCWNPCADPILAVERHESQSINPNGYEGPTRIERISAIICPWHIRGQNDRISFSKTNVTIVRSRGRKHLKDKNKLTDDAGHLIPSLLGGIPDIDRNAFPQAATSSRQPDYRRSEQYIAKFLQHKSPKDGSRLVYYDIVMNYDDSTGTSATSTRPASIHYVANFYEFQADESFKLVEISTETQDNSPEYIYGNDKEDL